MTADQPGMLPEMFSRLTPQEEARRGWSADYSIFDELAEQPETVAVDVFMGNHNLDSVGMREALREFRSEGGYSPYEDRDILSTDFLNWFRWERL